MAMEENEKIKDAVKCYNELTGDEEVKRLAEVRLMAQLEEQSALASARAKGEEEGLKQGERKNKEKIAIKLLKLQMPTEKIIEITELSQEELEEIMRKIK